MCDGMNEGKTALLFVYGTLRRGSGHPMARQLALRARYLGAGRVNGRLYRIGHYPGLLPTTQPREWVDGDLYDLCLCPGLLARLDRYEGLGRGRHRPLEYERVVTTVWLADGTARTAWVYSYRKRIQRLPRLFTGDFLRERRRHPHC